METQPTHEVPPGYALRRVNPFNPKWFFIGILSGLGTIVALGVIFWIFIGVLFSSFWAGGA